MRHGKLWLVVVTLVLLPVAAAAKKTYLFAVLPQQPPVAMHASWRPFLDQLGAEVGVNFKLKLYESMAPFEDDLRRGTGDFVFLTPPQMVIARQSRQYQPLVRGSRTIAGVLFVRKDSPIKTVADLNHKDIAFVGSRNV